ncbi:AAA family ATPase [Pelagibius sp. Alg239-R121]|uniref:AAA family ATPase n=1 Tax=Pelagibius sp. Alg239-R121 TaxID=2993448 RepID=UPI0024A764CB|nr:AAA family ATPase [Pelagibius sp. Alg239-R121]
MLIILGGLPGTGKTTLSKALARRLDAFHLRIDTIEQAIRNSSMAPASMDESGYLVAYAVAEDNLRLGKKVIADSVNPIAITREAWLKVAQRAAVAALEVEVICTDKNEHRRRVETRVSDIPGLRPPSWQDVLAREYIPWVSANVVADTALETIEQAATRISSLLNSD